MDVDVKVATMLARKADPPLEESRFGMSVEPGTSIEDLIAILGVPRSLVGSVTVNKKRTTTERVLEEGDAVAIIPSISGG